MTKKPLQLLHIKILLENGCFSRVQRSNSLRNSHGESADLNPFRLSLDWHQDPSFRSEAKKSILDRSP